MPNMKRIFFSIFILIIGLLLYYRQHPLIAKVRIAGNTFFVEVAVTGAQKQRGLGGRDTLQADHGMLFPYDHKEQYEFWMRGMRFPLDFIWIDGTVVADISENIPPPNAGERPLIIKPTVAVNTVLEVPAGTVQRLGISVGDTVEFLDR